uniref:Bulb-type lectin domain-containing protein n=1 Tax=Angiostrongylus cantonensis TaxID=6313 RepID=A0A0K0CWS4_ANGCA
LDSGGGSCPRSIDIYQIRDLFSGGPSTVQAAVFNPVSGMMLLFSNRQAYGYYFSRLRGKYQIDSGFPKTLPSDISFSPSGAIRWINGHQMLLSNSDEFSVYDEFWNQSTMNNRISSYLANFPEGVKGIESPSGSIVTAFTSNVVFQYNARTKRVESETALSSYLQC